MGYIAVFLILLMLGIVAVLMLPEVGEKNGIIRIGTVINKKYDLQLYNLDVWTEQRRDLRGRRYWCVCIYVYEKSAPDVCVRKHLLPVVGFRKSAEKKRAKVEWIIKGLC